MPEPLVVIKELSKRYAPRQRAGGAGVFAVQGVNLDICPGETLGIVGESGCGKSTLGRMAVGLLEPTGGDVLFSGKSLFDPAKHDNYAAFRKSLAGVVQMVFQDPQSSLNPRMRVGECVAEPLRCSTAWRQNPTLPPKEDELREKTLAMLEQVGLGADAAKRYPHEFSGGQRQRVAIARALVTRPSFVVCDEPTSSLDASVQSQVLNLLRDMQDSLGLTYCFISHDLAVVRHMSDKVAVMYAGLVVEEGDAETLFTTPLHPYTVLLLDSVPGLARRAGKGAAAPAEAAPRPMTNPACPFAPRCPRAMPQCENVSPPLAPHTATGEARRVRCWLYCQENA